jgi:anti-anti-sigma factor
MLKPSIETHNVNGILVAEFWDCLRLDPAPVQDLRKHYELHLQRNGRPDLVVDLSGVGFAGSAALGNFVALQRMVRHGGGRFLFCNVDATVTEVFRASKLESLFEFVADRPTAVRAVTDGLATDSPKKRPTDNDGVPSVKPPNPGRPSSGPLRRRNHDPEST